jgi:hypothetical protein
LLWGVVPLVVFLGDVGGGLACSPLQSWFGVDI